MKLINLPTHKLKQKKYSISVGENILENIPNDLKKRFKYNKYCIITDSLVKNLYANNLYKELKKSNIKCELLTFKEGEKSKNLKVIEKLLNQMLKKGFDRNSCVIAIGGGVTGDIAGFAASIFMRGINHIHIPTTLLSMADSSIGGKTGVNTIHGKNLIGSFQQPIHIYSDINVLQTLPLDHIQSGYAEIIKQAAIGSLKFFQFLEKNNEKILEKDKRILEKVIIEAAKIKATITSKDTKENNKRMFLNYGHTYGHAIEKALKYNIHHGAAVAIGMVMINKIAVKKGLMNKEDSKRINTLIKKAGLPTSPTKKLTKQILNKFMQTDKKRKNGKQNWVIVIKIGEPKIIQF